MQYETLDGNSYYGNYFALRFLSRKVHCSQKRFLNKDLVYLPNPHGCKRYMAERNGLKSSENTQNKWLNYLEKWHFFPVNYWTLIYSVENKKHNDTRKN